MAAVEVLAREREAELENAQRATVMELEDLHATTAEELTDVHATNASGLIRAHKRTGELERCMAEFEQVLKSLIRGGEDAADLEVHVRTLGQELSVAEHAGMEV